MQPIRRPLLYLALAMCATAATAWIAFHLQQEGFAPAVLLPAISGAALGTALAAIERLARAPGRRAAVSAAVLWGVLAAAGQDYIGHRHRLRHYEAELARDPLAAAVADGGALRPTLGRHLAATIARGPLWWTLDLALTACGSVVVVACGPRWRAALSARAPDATRGAG